MDKFLNYEDILDIVKNLSIDNDKLENKNILLTGGFGFIGKYILEVLILLRDTQNTTFNIFVVDNFITSQESSLNYYKNKNISCINGDINKPLDLKMKFDTIICLAGIASPYYYNKFPLETLNVSINGVLNMFELKHDENTKIIFFSSSEIYGDPPINEIPTKETYRGNVTSIGPRACYDESKRVGETICYIQNEKYKRKTAIIRPFNVYGPGMNLNDYRIIPNITRSVLKNEELLIYDTGKQTRTYCYVSDAIIGFMKVFFKDENFGVYNIGNDSGEISVLDLVKKTEQVINEKINYKITDYPKEYPADQPNRRCPDIEKAKINLGYVPKINLNLGLQKHLDWSKKTFNID